MWKKAAQIRYISALFALGLVLAPFQAVFADISSWERGGSIQPTSPTQYASSSFNQSLANLQADNANYVNLVIPIYQTDTHSADITAGGDTPTDAALISAIDTAHALGLKVSLKPHVETRNWQWRATIDPTDRALWFQNYGLVIKHYALIAQSHHVEQLIIGTELIDLTADDYNAQNTPGWRGIISQVRAVYSGSVVYAANWGPSGTSLDEKNRIAFWDAIDVVGIDAYYPMGTDFSDMSVNHFISYWAQVDQTDIKPFQERVGKPIVFTEVGYRSTTGAHVDPGNFQINNGVNLTEQANLYTALFSYWNDKSYIAGVHVWNWDGDAAAGGSNDVDYTPQGKPAEAVLKQWFGLTGTVTVPVGPLPTNAPPSFDALTTVPAGTSNINNPLSFTTAVTDGGGALDSALVDIEIYDGNGSRVYQQFYDNQSFEAGSTKSFTTTWTPNYASNYKVKVGVFTSGWSHNYLWQENAQNISVTSNAVGTSAQSSYTATAAMQGIATVGATATEQATITSTGSVSNVLVDVEAFNPQGGRIAQQVYQSESFSAGQAKQYPISFTPNSTGAYTIKVGIFANNNWGANTFWSENAGTANVIATPVVVLPPVATTTSPVATSTQPVATSTTPVITTPPAAPSCPTTIPTNTFSGCYYLGKDSNTFKLNRTDATVNFDWGGGSPDSSMPSDNFSVVWQGKFNFDGSNYQFNATTDDGMRVYIDGQKVFDKWFAQVGTYQFNQAMTAGTHTIRIEYFEEGGGAQAKVSWNKVGAPAPVADTQAPSVPNNMNASAASTTQVTLSWNSSNDNVGVTGYKIYRNGNYLTTVTGTSFSDTNLTASTQYTYQVSATDSADNESGRSNESRATTLAMPAAPIVPVTCSAAIPDNAFSGCYYNSKNLTNLAFTRTDPTINFDWGGGSPDASLPSDNFSAIWQGNFSFDPAQYQFTVTADDGVRMYIDGVQVLDKWLDQVATYQVSQVMTAGAHTIKIEYYEAGGGAKAQVSWTRTGPVITQPVIVVPPAQDPAPITPVATSTPISTSTPSTPTEPTTPVVPVTPPAISTVAIISPNQNAKGTTSFQAYVPGMDLGSYSMYWQVDGDRLNDMYSSQNGTPHKQADLDLTGWNWKGAGPYTINFIAKDTANNILAQKSIDITL